MTLSWSIGLVVAGVSNFMAQPFASASTAPSVRSTSGSLNAFCCGRLGAGEQPSRDGLCAARHLGLGRLDAPRLVRDAADRDAAGAVALHDRADRDQRERIGRAVAHLAVDVRAADRLRQRHGGDQFARRQRRLDVRRVAGQTVEVGDRNAPRRPSGRTVSTVASSARIATAMSLGCVAMQASLTPITACCRLNPPMRRAAAARAAFVAGLVGVVEIRAAGALQQVAGGRRLVAQLAGSAGQQRARQQAIVPPHPRIGGEIGVAHQRADAQAAFRRRLDLVERKPVDVDQMRRASRSRSFIRSSRLVPPAMNLAPSMRAAAAAASAGEFARS